MQPPANSHFASELVFADKLASQLPSEQYASWYKCRSGHTFQGFYGKKLVAYDFESGVPTIRKVLVCEDLNVCLKSGTSSVWLDEDTGTVIRVAHTPTEVAPNCFMWHLQHSTLDFSEYRGSFNVKFNVAFRTAVNPRTKLPGKLYMTEYASFRQQYANTQ